jgi:tRNA-Thr(GGU) m(6)t(6)A37 methyltransferase TsaA
MESVEYKPIGVIKSPFKDLRGMPIQPIGACGVHGEIQLSEEYKDGLVDLEQFSHIVLIYHLHKSNSYSLRVKPFLDDKKHGIFATRAPKRPNQIGLSVVKLEGVEGATLHISNVDILDGTPLLDIKPYIPQFDRKPDEKVCVGWFEDKHQNASTKKSDGRFVD